MIQRKSGLLMPETMLECMDIPCFKCALWVTEKSGINQNSPYSVCLLDGAMQ